MIYSDNEEEDGLSLVPEDEVGFLLLSSSMRPTCCVTIGLKKRYPTQVNNRFISFIQFLLIPDSTPNITASTGALVALIMSYVPCREFSSFFMRAPPRFTIYATSTLLRETDTFLSRKRTKNRTLFRLAEGRISQTSADPPWCLYFVRWPCTYI